MALFFLIFFFKENGFICCYCYLVLCLFTPATYNLSYKYDIYYNVKTYLCLMFSLYLYSFVFYNTLH